MPPDPEVRWEICEEGEYLCLTEQNAKTLYLWLSSLVTWANESYELCKPPGE